ncbi:hypothetical protein [Streptococcus acidominimus]|uniref:Uncharacterized protein n=1 Tax=Streptococcus acidominimus TaxID=1326 RepID=A0A4Y9FNF2_STRAI|nr:hypothetical protein [Streptococcus acidominimus]MBF0818797.1 hypothetical protein [Streptococcus acidominimus]MBF0839206.1 hypothetical protein [Streptococcus acidominimus]MBF0849153.1 hypothetical protein [Streptococcus danieliae]TFU30747.1 hypothetical protein E4U01_04930 [Streptococcus acidominimus]
MVRNKRVRSQNKERYHGPLIASGVQLSYIKVYPWINLAPCIFFYFTAGFGDSIGVIKGILGVCILINLISITCSLLMKWLKISSQLIYLLIALFTTTTLIWTDFLGLIMVVANGQSLNANSFYQSLPAFMYTCLLVTLFVGMIFVYSYFYRRDSRTNGAYRDIEARFNTWDNSLLKRFSSNFWIIIGLVFLVPSFLTGFLQTLFGFSLGILLTLIFPAVIVDAFYAAIYERKKQL